MAQQRPTPFARRLIASLAVTAVALAPALPAIGAPSPGAALASEPAAPGSTTNLDLSGTWKFTVGDDPAYAEPSFDDSDWTSLQVPETDGAPQFADYDGFGWYRLTFDLPDDAEGQNLVASLGFLDDADEAFLNGVRIGSSGSMPPDAQSQWFEQRLYPVPAEAPVFGGTNTLSVRVYDMSGGGGWYQGPVGIYSKDAVREEVYGISGTAADADTAAWVGSLLDRQAAALASGDVAAYLATLAGDYMHDGRDRERRAEELRSWMAASGSLRLDDAGVEIIRSDDGRLLVDTNRAIIGTKDGAPFEFQPRTQQFLTIDPASRTESGNRARFFRDFVESGLEGARREYVTYLPPSYFEDPNREYPVVYLLHGVNGGSREWEPRDFGAKLDELYTSGGLEESIVVMPDGESLWYVDHQDGTPWRSMFIDELIPQVDAEYRTIAHRDFRGLSGVSMGGFGAYSIGLAHPELFSSLASHMGALSLAPAVVGVTSPGGPAGQSLSPLADVAARTGEQLSRHEFFFDACEDDDYRFDDAVRSLDALLDGKGVRHTSEVYPVGRHNDDCWVPRIGDSFGLHSDHVRASLDADTIAPTVTASLDPTTRHVRVEASDDTGVSRIEYSLNRRDGSFETYTGPIPVGDRAVTVQVRAVDTSGNVSGVVSEKFLPSKAKGGRR
ncbi:alpha/beta hydrolase-fold protein [Arthrobacter sp. Ld5]|uniref:alpha/beta hydrolase-fold protein n=1 Tax=Arthrobacter sp. Ld5 TaxID=649152 RepID=UPI003EBD1B00